MAGEFNSVPFEIIGVPFEIWEAPVGTTFPDIDADPSAPWAKVGTSGKLNYSDDGVTVEFSETVSKFRGASTAVRKQWRTEEDVMVKAKVLDLTLEQVSRALNFNTVSDIPGGTQNSSKVGLFKGAGIAQRAVVVRGPSPYLDGALSQFCIPVASVQSSTSVQFKKGEPAGFEITWTAYADPDASSEDETYGYLQAATDVAS